MSLIVNNLMVMIFEKYCEEGNRELRIDLLYKFPHDEGEKAMNELFRDGYIQDLHDKRGQTDYKIYILDKLLKHFNAL